MAAEQVATTASPAVAPNLQAASLENAGAFLRAAGLIFDEITATGVTGHLDLSPDHHTPWGIVHGGVYTTAIESAASVGASEAVRDQAQVAVGLMNTTHFLRSATEGRVNVGKAWYERLGMAWTIEVRFVQFPPDVQGVQQRPETVEIGPRVAPAGHQFGCTVQAPADRGIGQQRQRRHDEAGTMRRDEDIAREVYSSVSTVYRVRKRFAEHGLQAALFPKDRPRPRRLVEQFAGV